MTRLPAMKRILLALSTVIGVVVFASSAVSATTEHCPDHEGNPGKVEGANNSVVLPAGTEFCVKGSTTATGVLTADGETTLYEYLGIDKDVSYYVVYRNGTTTTTTTSSTTTTTTTEPEQTTTTTVYHPPCIDCFATTTVAETTTTVAETSTTSTEPPVVTTTTPPPPPTTQPPATPQLPETGSTSGLLAAIAALLTFAGGAALWARRA